MASECKTTGNEMPPFKKNPKGSSEAPSARAASKAASPPAFTERQTSVLHRVETVQGFHTRGWTDSVVKAIDAAGAVLRQSWPAGVPKPRDAHLWTENDLDRLEPVVKEAEGYFK